MSLNLKQLAPDVYRLTRTEHGEALPNKRTKPPLVTSVTFRRDRSTGECMIFRANLMMGRRELEAEVGRLLG